jgi:hypothetical protein
VPISYSPYSFSNSQCSSTQPGWVRRWITDGTAKWRRKCLTFLVMKKWKPARTSLCCRLFYFVDLLQGNQPGVIAPPTCQALPKQSNVVIPETPARESAKIQMTTTLFLQWIYHSYTWCAIWIISFSLAGPCGDDIFSTFFLVFLLKSIFSFDFSNKFKATYSLLHEIWKMFNESSERTENRIGIKPTLHKYR